MKIPNVEDIFLPVKNSSVTSTKTIVILMLFSLFYFITTISLSIKTLLVHQFFITIRTYDDTTLPDSFPFQMDFYTLLILAFIILILSFILFIFVAFRIFIFKDTVFYDVLYGEITRYLFFPIILNGSLFLFSPIVMIHQNMYTMALFVPGLVLSLISIISLCFIYVNTKFKGNIKGFIVKKCFMTSLIFLDLYYFLYNMVQMIIEEHGSSSVTGINISFQIILLIIGAAIIFKFKDLGWGVCCCLMWAGIIIYSQKKKGSLIKSYSKINLIMGCICIPIIFIETILVGVFFKKKCLK